MRPECKRVVAFLVTMSGNDMAAKTPEDDDVPPLEDMSETLERISALRVKQTVENFQDKLPKTTYLEATESDEQAKFRSVQTLLGKDDSKLKKEAIPTAKDVPSKSSAKPLDMKKKAEGFGGFKKGFLLSNTKQPDSKRAKEKSAPKVEKIEEIKKPEANKLNNPLILNEVQEALADQVPLLKSKDWITEDLVSKVEKNPKLMKQLDDPRFSQALTAFQKNPQQAMLAVQNDPEVKEFIQEFCGLLGEHFTNLGDKEVNKKSAMKKPIETLEASSSRKFTPGGKTSSKQSEEEKFQRMISDPEIRDILSDEKIRCLIGSLKENPGAAQRTLSEMGPEYHGKIQKLIEAGILGVARP